MMGYQGYRGWAAFAKNEGPFIAESLNLSYSKWPSDSTIKRVISGIDTDHLMKIFNEWMSLMNLDKKLSEGVCIDGKSIKSTVINYQFKSQDFVTIVSRFSQAKGLVLQLAKLTNKSGSEIEQVRELLRNSTDTNQLITLDALHCQKASLALIKDTNNDYLVPVKKNQKNLVKHIETVCQSQSPQSSHTEFDKSHGRTITRQVSVFNNVPNDKLKGWPQINSLIKVERTGYRGAKMYKQTMYYISSLSAEASFFADKIRGHWRIENQLHWVKDVIFDEDNWPIRQFQPATNLSVLRTICLNLFRFLGFLSVTEAYNCLGKRVERYLFLLE
jgi:predicted transposase YbfD/YdcC